MIPGENNEESEDYDLYHVDFTTASEWEVFIARIEEILQEWKLHTAKHLDTLPDLSRASWLTESESINFADFEFTLTRHYVKHSEESVSKTTDGDYNELPQASADLMNVKNNFLPKSETDTSDFYTIVRLYGLRDFVLLTPVKGFLNSESRLKVLLSSFAVALNNIGCQVPIFVRYLEPWQKFFIGICESPDFRTEFEMVHLKKIPSQCKHLTGLLNLFKSKIGQNEFIEPITVAARFSYTLNDWSNFAWSQEPPDIELISESGWSELGSLPFGSLCEPISTLTVMTSWPEVLETMAVDNESYSDFDPSTAPLWSVTIGRSENLVCLLTDYFTEFLFFCMSNKSTEDLLGDFVHKDGGDMLQPFSLLTDSRLPSLSSLLSLYGGARSKSVEGPVSQRLLMPILYYLFPDVEENSKHPYSTESELDKGATQRMKSCGRDSLLWRLALVMSHALHMLGGPRASAHIWHEFTQEIRFRWNSSNLVPGVSPGFPDPKTCLLHQKLQMINCCIERKLKRESTYLEKEDKEEESEEEVFFDCSEESGEPSAAGVAAGRLHPHGSLRLIKTGEPLYVPLTQGATPKTEDQLDEESQVLIQLGADAEGSQLRAKIMSASLLSDMESFKAANPGAVIEDFIRWYSPRDWIEEEELDEFGQRKGRLSPRMTLPGNTWLEVWDTARPLPAVRQKRLFDETREAEKALHFLESQPPGRSGELILPVMAHAVAEKLAEESKDIWLPLLKTTVQTVLKRVEALTRHVSVDIRRYQELCLEVGSSETLISQIKSLESKLGADEDIKELLWKLVAEGEVVLPEATKDRIASKLTQLFVEAHKVTSGSEGGSGSGGATEGSATEGLTLPAPSEREFVLRGSAPRPHRFARPSPHFLRVRLSREDISMAAAYSQDKVFF